MYADDTQLYIFMRKGDRDVALENLSLCLDDIGLEFTQYA